MLHDDVILLLQPKCFNVSLSWKIMAFAILNLTGIANFKYERKNEWMVVVVVVVKRACEQFSLPVYCKWKNEKIFLCQDKKNMSNFLIYTMKVNVSP